MKHRIKFRKLNRTSSHRWAMLRTMASQLLQHERIETTLPKAKEVRRVAENMIQLGKRGDLHARRQAAAVLRGDEVLHKVFQQLATRYQGRPGGYTRIVPTRIRQGDAALMGYIELVDRPGELRFARPASQPHPPTNTLPPWLMARYRMFAPPKIIKQAEASSEPDGNSS